MDEFAPFLSPSVVAEVMQLLRYPGLILSIVRGCKSQIMGLCGVTGVGMFAMEHAYANVKGMRNLVQQL